jgi:hypothetical protein
MESKVLSVQLPHPGKVKAKSALKFPTKGKPLRLKSASHLRFCPWLRARFGAEAATADLQQLVP